MTETQTDIGPAAALYGALAKAQGAFQPIVKNREVEITMKTGGRYKFRYADLEEILTKTRPALSANGLALIQTVEHGQQGALLVCRLMHAQGGMMASEVAMTGVRDLGDPKTFGAAITYLRRYMVTAMLGVAADDDLDEDGQGVDDTTTTGRKPAVSAPQRRAEAQPDTQAAGDMTPCTQGEIAFLTKKLEAKGWTKAQGYEAAGITYDEGAAMTKADFTAIKAVL